MPVKIVTLVARNEHCLYYLRHYCAISRWQIYSEDSTEKRNSLKMAWQKVWRPLAYFIKGVKPGLTRLLNFPESINRSQETNRSMTDYDTLDRKPHWDLIRWRMNKSVNRNEFTNVRERRVREAMRQKQKQKQNKKHHQQQKSRYLKKISTDYPHILNGVWSR